MYTFYIYRFIFILILYIYRNIIHIYVQHIHHLFYFVEKYDICVNNYCVNIITFIATNIVFSCNR